MLNTDFLVSFLDSFLDSFLGSFFSFFSFLFFFFFFNLESESLPDPLLPPEASDSSESVVATFESYSSATSLSSPGLKSSSSSESESPPESASARINHKLRLSRYTVKMKYTGIAFLSFSFNSSQVCIGSLFLVGISKVFIDSCFFLRSSTINIPLCLQLYKLTERPVFLTRSFFPLIKSNSRLYSSFSILLKVCTTPLLVSTSKSKERVLPPPRAKLTLAISSNLADN